MRANGVLRLERSIGSEAAPTADYEFAEVIDVHVAANGTLYVIDGAVRNGSVIRPKVRQFDSLGRFVRLLGHEGDGPGEYRSPTGLTELPDGMIAVRDATAPEKILLYGKDGAFDRSIRLRSGRMWPMHGSRSVFADKAGVLWMPALPVRPGLTERTIVLIAMRRDGTILHDSIPVPIPPAPVNPLRVVSRLPGGGRSVRGAQVPYAPRGLWEFGSDGKFAIARSENYHIDLIPAVSKSGADRAAIEREVAPVLVSADEQADLHAKMTHEVEALGIADLVHIPAAATQKPPLRGLFFSEDGQLVVYRSEASQRQAGKWVEPQSADIFARDGRFEGHVMLPPSFNIYRMRKNRLWGVYRDDDGAESVRQYGIDWVRPPESAVKKL